MRSFCLVVIVIFSCLVSTKSSYAWWVHQEWDSTCALLYMKNKWKYTITRDESKDSPRVTVKELKVWMKLDGTIKTKTCADENHCDWLIEEYNNGCGISCSWAEVTDFDGSVTKMGRDCVDY